MHVSRTPSMSYSRHTTPLMKSGRSLDGAAAAAAVDKDAAAGGAADGTSVEAWALLAPGAVGSGAAGAAVWRYAGRSDNRDGDDDRVRRGGEAAAAAAGRAGDGGRAACGAASLPAPPAVSAATSMASCASNSSSSLPSSSDSVLRVSVGSRSFRTPRTNVIGRYNSSAATHKESKKKKPFDNCFHFRCRACLC